MAHIVRNRSALPIVSQRLARAFRYVAICLIAVGGLARAGEGYSVSAPGKAGAARLRLSPPVQGRESGDDSQAVPLTIKLSDSAPGIGVPKTLEGLRFHVGKEFTCVQRGPYLVAGDLSPADFERLVDGILSFCNSALVKQYFRTVPEDTVTIYIFRNYQRYRAGLRRLFQMEPISPYGHYSHMQNYLAVNFETGPGTFVHELIHALMAADFPKAPIWIGEGIASLYEQCRVEDNRLRGEPNWRLPELLEALNAGAVTPLDELITLNPGAFRAKNESRHYAEARYFCKYLEELEILGIVYREFRDNFADDPTGRKFITKAAGKSLSLLEADWKRWLARQSWHEPSEKGNR